jgi:hypothetical protein
VTWRNLWTLDGIQYVLLDSNEYIFFEIVIAFVLPLILLPVAVLFFFLLLNAIISSTMRGHL